MANKRYDQFVVGSDTGEKIFLTANPSTGELGKIDLTELFSINSIRLQEAKGANITAANDLTLGLDGNLFIITGNTTINAITTANWQAGSSIAFVFTGTPTLKHNTAGGAGTATMLLAGAADFDAAAADCIYLKYDGTNWHEITRKLAASGKGNTVTADNGLTKNNAHNVQLGDPTQGNAPLLHDTYITAGGFLLTIDGNNASNYVLGVTNSLSGYAIEGNNSSSGGAGIHAIATASNATALLAETINSTATTIRVIAVNGLSATFIAQPTTTNTIHSMLQIHRQVNGTAADGVGGSLDFYNNVDNNDDDLSNQIISKWTTAANATRTSQLDITGVNSAATGTIASFYGSGIVGIGISSGYVGTRLEVVDDALAGANMVYLHSNSTAATGNAQKLLNVSLSGANSNNNQTTYAGYFSNTHTGTGNVNYGLYGTTTSTNGSLSAGIYGVNTSTGYGIHGESSGAGTAIQGDGPSTGYGVVGSVSSSGVGVRGNSSSGRGIEAFSSSGTGLVVFTSPAATNTVTTIANFMRQTLTNGANGIGGSLDFNATTTTTGDVLANQLIWQWTDAAHATRTSSMILNGVLSGTTVDLLTLAGDGSVKLRPITATAASAITPAEGMMLFVSSTNGTFTSIGFWGYQNGAWHAF